MGRFARGLMGRFARGLDGRGRVRGHRALSGGVWGGVIIWSGGIWALSGGIGQGQYGEGQGALFFGNARRFALRPGWRQGILGCHSLIHKCKCICRRAWSQRTVKRYLF